MVRGRADGTGEGVWYRGRAADTAACACYGEMSATANRQGWFLAKTTVTSWLGLRI